MILDNCINVCHYRPHDVEWRSCYQLTIQKQTILCEYYNSLKTLAVKGRLNVVISYNCSITLADTMVA